MKRFLGVLVLIQRTQHAGQHLEQKSRILSGSELHPPALPQLLQVWALSIPLPAVMMITVGLYMTVLGVGLWIRYCLKDYCSLRCCSCCPDVSLCDQCFRLAEMCDCRLPAVSSFLPDSCSSPSLFQFLLRKIVEKQRFQTLGDLRKQWTESGEETPRAAVLQACAGNGKQWQKRLTCMSLGNQGARVWRKTGEKETPKRLKSRVQQPQSVMVWAPCQLLLLVHWVLSRVNAASRRLWSTSCFHLLKSFMEKKISFFSPTWYLLTEPKPLVTGLLTVGLLGSEPEPHRESVGYCEEKAERRQTEHWG